MKNKHRTSEIVFVSIAALISWFAVIFDFIQATSFVSAKNEYELISPLEYLSFMTVWTNLIIAFFYTLLLLNRKWKLTKFIKLPVVSSAIVVYILIVGITYHFMLSGLWNPKGLRLVTDLMLHYIIPAIFIIYWLIFVKHGAILYKKIFIWLSYPLIYAVFILLRGSIVHKYPYPFLDANELGYPAVLITLGVFLIGYYLLSNVIWLIDYLISKSFSRN